MFFIKYVVIEKEWLRGTITSQPNANYDLGKRVEETEKYLNTLTLSSINVNDTSALTKRKKLKTVKERDQIKKTSTTTTTATTSTTPTKVAENNTTVDII